MRKLLDWFLSDYLTFKQAVLRSQLEQAEVQIAKLRTDLYDAESNARIDRNKILALGVEQQQLKANYQSSLQTIQMLQTFQAEHSTQQDALRLAVQAEFQRVGTAVAEIHTRFENLPKPEPVSPEPELSQRITVIERLLSSMADLAKPGNHIRPGHTFGNKVRL